MKIFNERNFLNQMELDKLFGAFNINELPTLMGKVISGMQLNPKFCYLLYFDFIN